MTLLLRRLTFVFVLTTVSSLLSPVQAAVPEACTKILAAPQNGLKALSNLQGNFAAVAALNGKSESVLRNILETDSSYWLDVCGLGFYVEEVPKNVSSNVNVSAAPYAYDQTFRLHSKPGSSKTIYLDFNGHSYSGTAWNSYFRVASPYFASGYSQDADFANFTNAEMDVIQSVWQRVSEDYAPFDVDVTTEEPVAGVLERSTTADTIYGTRAVVTSDSGMQAVCGCGGVAYVGVFDNTGTAWSNYQPAWVFTRGVGNGAKNITEALTHEVGHNLGLSHDGRTVPQEGYYYGAAGWAPIMGVGYNQGLTQWSKGEYPNANNTEDDYVVMSNNGLTFRGDEDSNSAATARLLSSSISGIISNPADSDWYGFTAASSGNVTISANVGPTSPNLDIRLDLYQSSDLSTPLATANPSMTVVSGDSIAGLSASLTYSVLAGTTYYLKVDGVGFGDLASTGYSDYGSLGNYTLTSSGIDSAYAISTASFSPTSNSVVEGFTTGTSSTLTLNRTGNSGSDPVATLSFTGGSWNIASATNISFSGTPPLTGSSTLTLTNPSVNSSGSIVLTLNSGAVAGTYIATLTVGSQTLATYTVTVSSGSVPNQVQGLICSKNNNKTGKCSWSALSPAPIRYEYRYKASTALTWQAWVSTSLSTSVTIGGLRSGVIYDVQVQAVNNVGPGSSASTQLRM
jgi:hypothetical protein